MRQNTFYRWERFKAINKSAAEDYDNSFVKIWKISINESIIEQFHKKTNIIDSA